MPFNTKSLITDAGTMPAPQYFNPTAGIDAYEVITGSGGALNVNITGTVAVGTHNIGTVTTVTTVSTLTSITNAVKLDANSFISGSSTANLAANGSYTGNTVDLGTTNSAYNRYRCVVAHTAGNQIGHLALEQSADNATWRETHKVPIPSDGLYRTFDLPINLRYSRYRFYNSGGAAQSLFFFSGLLVRLDGGTDYDKTITYNHSTTNLASGGSFTGTPMHVGGNHSFNRHRTLVFADQPGTLLLQQSRDGTIWRTTQSGNVSANVAFEVEDLVVHQYQRVVYNNGTTAQGAFELYTSLVRQ